MLRTVLLGAGVFAALMALLIFSGKLPVGQKKAAAQGDVMIWGTVDEGSMNTLIQAFNPQAQTYHVSYREIPEAQFSQKLTEALADGTGPDLVIAPHQYLLANASRLYPFPTASLSQKSFNTLYVDGASIFWSQGGALALPVSIDPLVLFYNRSLLSKAGIINPPQYWAELVGMVPRLTILNQQGVFIQSAISLGAPNTPFAKEILMSTVMQLGQTPVFVSYQPDGTQVTTVLANQPTTQGGDVYPLATAARFFSQFSDPAKPTYTWSQYGGSAIDQFLAEKVAMYIGHASDFATLKSRNPIADIDMAVLPQTSGYNTFVMTGDMYGIAALKTSKNLVAALTAEGQLGGSVYGPQIASMLDAAPALRQDANDSSLGDVVRKSMLVARPWYDKFPVESMNLAASMFTDILSGKIGPAEAGAAFVTRLQDLYTPI